MVEWWWRRPRGGRTHSVVGSDAVRAWLAAGGAGAPCGQLFGEHSSGSASLGQGGPMRNCVRVYLLCVCVRIVGEKAEDCSQFLR